VVAGGHAAASSWESNGVCNTNMQHQVTAFPLSLLTGFLCSIFVPRLPHRVPKDSHRIIRVPSRVELPKQERVSPKVLRKSLEFQRKKTYFFSGILM
jgi:hypothetical protein